MFLIRTSFAILSLYLATSFAFAGEVTITPVTHQSREKGDFQAYRIGHSDQPEQNVVIFMANPKVLFLDFLNDEIYSFRGIVTCNHSGWEESDNKYLKGNMGDFGGLTSRGFNAQGVGSSNMALISFDDVSGKCLERKLFHILVKIDQGQLIEVSEFKGDVEAFRKKYQPSFLDELATKSEAEIKAIQTAILGNGGDGSQLLAFNYLEGLKQKSENDSQDDDGEESDSSDDSEELIKKNAAEIKAMQQDIMAMAVKMRDAAGSELHALDFMEDMIGKLRVALIDETEKKNK